MYLKRMKVLLLCTICLLILGLIAAHIIAEYNRTGKSNKSDKQAMFMGNLQHTGVYNTKDVADNVELKWKIETGGGIFSSPVILGNVCYFGSNDGFFYAADAKTGKVKWKYKTGGEIRSTPAICDNIAYITNTDGYLYAIGIEQGELKWKFETKGEKAFDDWDMWLSSPCVHEGVVYFGSGDGNLYALDAKSGNKMWQYETQGIIHSSPAIYKDMVYFGDFKGYCYAIDINTHELKWEYKTIGYPDIPVGEIESSPTIYNDIVYIGSKDHTIYALDAQQGTLMWKQQVYPGWVCSTPAVKDGIVCIGKTGSNSVYGLDTETGKLKWLYNTRFFVFSSAAIAGNTVYIGNFSGKLFALDLHTGKEKWIFQTDTSKTNYSEFFDKYGDYKRVAFTTYKEYIEKYTSNLGSFMSAPVVCDGVIYFGSTDGNLYALQ